MTNKQLAITKYSPNIREAAQIIETEVPAIGANEVLVKNNYIGINALYDLELYRGNVPYIQMEFPYVFGVEAVGTIMDIGKDVNTLRKGDAISTVKVGTAYQEYQVVTEENSTLIPKATPEYLTLNPTGVSSYLAMKNVAQLQPKEIIVVSAAAGGLGHIIVQLAKQKQCHVVAICGTQEKVDLLQSLNCCDRIISHRKENVDAVLTQEYNGKIDVAFDSVGRNIFDTFVKNIAPLGRVVVSGLAAEINDDSFEKVHRARVYETLYWKGASVRCFMNHLYKTEHPEVRRILFEQYKKGELQVKVDETSFKGIESIINASEYLLAGKSCGKVVVQL